MHLDKPISLPAALGILGGTVLLVLVSGLLIGYRFFWNQFDQTTRLDAELSRWNQVLSKDPGSFEALYQLGWTYYQKGDFQKALEFSKTASEVQPEHAGAQYNIGLAYFELKQFEPALGQFRALADQYPRHELAWLSLGRTYLELGKDEEAVKTLQYTLTINPTSSDVHFALGSAFEHQNEKDKAIGEYKNALTYDPKYGPAVEALHRLGVSNQ